MKSSHFVRTDWLFELSIVLRSLSVLWTFGFASLCQHNSPIRYASWAKHSPRLKLWAIGYGLLGIGYWWLVIGYWIWAAKPHIRAFTRYSLRFTLLAIAPLPLASNFSPHCALSAKGSVLTQMPQADAGAIQSSAGQNLRKVRRALHFDHREISSLDRSEGHCNIVVVSSSMLR